MVRGTSPSQDASTNQILDSYLKYCRRYAPDTIILGMSDTKMLCDTLPSQDASTHLIWNAFFKNCKRYTPGTIILETRSGVKVSKIRVTRKCYETLHP